MTHPEWECCRKTDQPGRDVICHRHSSFKIQVIELHYEDFRPDQNEVHFYGDNHGDDLAFQTIGYKNQSQVFMLDAIHWYANYLGYADMKIFNQPPL